MTGNQFGFSFDIARCSGCMACMVACFDQNDMPGNESTFRHVTKIEAGEYPAATIQYVSLACMHCGDAPCIAVCPTKAISKKPENGIAVVSRESCIGCHACATVCPFGAPQFPDGTLMSKCDLCVARVESGYEPACARTCPTKALGFGTMEELTEQKAKKAASTIASAALPSMVIILP